MNHKHPFFLNCIDAAHIRRQISFSTKTFGPGIRQGVVDHLRKELIEVEESNLTDLGEWVDIIILGLDGAWRAGYDPQDIIDAIIDKQTVNELRKWPNWKDRNTNEAIEHIRETER